MKTQADIISKTIRLRHWLHLHPELSGEEIRTKQKLMEFLRQNTSLEIIDRGQWFYGKFHAAGSRGGIAFRADFDAVAVDEDNRLPYASRNRGVAHKCGHDGHSSALCAFAMMVEAEGADRDVYFIFQHAEETGAGAELASRLIEDEDIQEVYAIHNYPGKPFGSVNIKTGVICCASLGMELIFTGSPAHASAPELGKNPAETISRLVLELDDLRGRFAGQGLLMATVIQMDVGQRAFGVAASRGKLLLTVRGEREDALEGFVRGIREEAAALCEKAGLSLDVKHYDSFPETRNHQETVEKIAHLCRENDIPLVMMEEPLRTSEDFGWFLKKTPGALIWLGAGEDAAPLHDKDYDYNDDLIEKSCSIFRMLLNCG